MGHLKEASKGIFSGLSGLFGTPAPQENDLVEKAKKADVYLTVNASTVELTDIERYTEEVAGNKPLIMWNLGLDTLRADLGTCTSPPYTLWRGYTACRLGYVYHPSIHPFAEEGRKDYIQHLPQSSGGSFQGCRCSTRTNQYVFVGEACTQVPCCACDRHVHQHNYCNCCRTYRITAWLRTKEEDSSKIVQRAKTFDPSSP